MMKLTFVSSELSPARNNVMNLTANEQFTYPDNLQRLQECMTDEPLRITIMLDPDIAKASRQLQSDMIKKTGRSVSFSSCVSVLITIGLKDIGQARALIKKKYP